MRGPTSGDARGIATGSASCLPPAPVFGLEATHLGLIVPFSEALPAVERALTAADCVHVANRKSPKLSAFRHAASGACELRVRFYDGQDQELVELACSSGTRSEFLAVYACVAAALVAEGAAAPTATSLAFATMTPFVPRALPASMAPAVPPAPAFDATPLVALVSGGALASRRDATAFIASVAGTAPVSTLEALVASPLAPALVAAAACPSTDATVRLNAVSALTTLSARLGPQSGVAAILGPLVQGDVVGEAVRGCSAKLAGQVAGLLRDRLAALTCTQSAPRSQAKPSVGAGLVAALAGVPCF